MSSVVISGDTSGAITLSAPAVSGTNTATLPAATGTVMVSGNMPAFSAYQSSAQSISASTSTLVQFQTKEYDTASAFNNTGSTVGNALAYGFNPQVAGYYQINSAIQGSAADMTVAWIYKNASIVKQGNWIPFQQATAVSAQVYMNGTTDCIQIYVYKSATSNLATGASAVYFQAVMVRAA